MFIQHTCPGCGSANVVKNSHTYSGKARNKGKACGRQFIVKRCQAPLSAEQKVPARAEVGLQCPDCQSDEMWSFVGRKANKQWLWVAQDRASRQILGLFVGDRSRAGAPGLWEALPEVYRRQARFHTDEWEAYQGVIPPRQHHHSKHKERHQSH